MTTGAKPEVLVVSPIPADLRAGLAEDFDLVDYKADMGKRPGSTVAVTMAIFGAMTIWFLSSTSALFALSTGAGSLVGILQNRLLARSDLRGSSTAGEVSRRG